MQFLSAMQEKLPIRICLPQCFSTCSDEPINNINNNNSNNNNNINNNNNVNNSFFKKEFQQHLNYVQFQSIHNDIQSSGKEYTKIQSTSRNNVMYNIKY